MQTGGSKGYAFIEFDCVEVAKIVAETMNNYLMGERIIKCEYHSAPHCGVSREACDRTDVHAAVDSSLPGHVMPPEKVHEKLFDGSGREFKMPQNPAVKRYNKRRTEEQIAEMTKKLLQKENKLRKRLAAHGIDYDFPGFVSEMRWFLTFTLIPQL